MNECRENIHENITEFTEHCSSNIQVPGEREEGGGQGGPQEPTKLRGNPAVQKAVDFLFKSKCFVNFLVHIDPGGCQKGSQGAPWGSQS